MEGGGTIEQRLKWGSYGEEQTSQSANATVNFGVTKYRFGKVLMSSVGSGEGGSGGGGERQQRYRSLLDSFLEAFHWASLLQVGPSQSRPAWCLLLLSGKAPSLFA